MNQQEATAASTGTLGSECITDGAFDNESSRSLCIAKYLTISYKRMRVLVVLSIGDLRRRFIYTSLQQDNSLSESN